MLSALFAGGTTTLSPSLVVPLALRAHIEQAFAQAQAIEDLEVEKQAEGELHGASVEQEELAELYAEEISDKTDKLDDLLRELVDESLTPFYCETVLQRTAADCTRGCIMEFRPGSGGLEAML